MKKPVIYTGVKFDTIVGGGQTLGQLGDGRKVFAWGVLPDEVATIQQAKKKSRFIEAIATEIEQVSDQRVAPRDPESYLSTSPWQIMDFTAEQHYKAALIEEAFELHDIVLPEPIEIYTDGREYEYRNKIEYSWWWDTDTDTLDLAFFRRGTKGKIPIEHTSLAMPCISEAATRVRDVLRARGVEAYDLKTLLVRANQAGKVIAQLYVKEEDFAQFFTEELSAMRLQGFELIYSNPKSPASVITKRLQQWGSETLSDTVLDVPFTYATEGFFQINLPVYEQALRDMREWVTASFSRPSTPSSPQARSAPTDDRQEPLASLLPKRQSLQEERSGELRNDTVANTAPTRVTRDEATPRPSASRGLGVARVTGPVSSDLRNEADGEEYDGSGSKEGTQKVIDLYSGVGSIGLTIGGDNVVLIESNEHAVREMERNIAALEREGAAKAVLAPSEKALEHITSDAIIIVDPPRAGLHENVIKRLLETKPPRIIYLSCNPVTQARDVARLAKGYGIHAHQGYNFFPRTPHIEHLVVLDKL